MNAKISGSTGIQLLCKCAHCIQYLLIPNLQHFNTILFPVLKIHTWIQAFAEFCISLWSFSTFSSLKSVEPLIANGNSVFWLLFRILKRGIITTNTFSHNSCNQLAMMREIWVNTTNRTVHVETTTDVVISWFTVKQPHYI